MTAHAGWLSGLPRRAETVLALTRTGLWELDPRRGVLEWSPATCALHGRPAGRPPALGEFFDALSASDRVAVLLAVETACEQPGRVATVVYAWHLDGAVRHLRAAITAEVNVDGGHLLAGTTQDVTEDVEARRELEAARAASAAASQVKSQFLANMSHEIRTPMNAVLGMTGLLLDSKLTDEQRIFATAARSSGTALLGIINDILDLSKIEAGKLVFEERCFDVREVVADVITSLADKAREKGIGLTAHVDSSVPGGTVGDPTRFRQVVTNLLANAVKFTSQGSVALRAVQEGPFLRVRVEDTGIGIPEGARQAIFEPFQQADTSMTRKFGGTGLGLSIVKQLVERMGGSIAVTSELGRGSTFEVSMRAAPFVAGAAVPAVDMTNALSAGSSEGTGPVASTPRALHVLVAEDDDTNALLARSYLKRLGHTMVRARNGAEAVARSASERFDVILMDVQMPELDGFEATAAIREREAASGTHVPIIAVTANAMKGDAELCLARGMDMYLSKPMNEAGLSGALARWR